MTTSTDSSDCGLAALEQLFYIEVGSASVISLQGFIAKVLANYKLMKYEGPKVFSFDSMAIKDSLQLKAASGIEPYIWGISIEERAEELSGLLAAHSGRLEAHYDALERESLHEQIRNRITGEAGAAGEACAIACKTKGSRVAQLDICTGGRFRNLRARLDALAKEERELIMRADALHIKQDFYENGDRRNALIILSCEAKNQGRVYHLAYSLSTANMSAIPEQFFPMINSVFDMVAARFAPITAYKAKVRDFRESGR